MLDHFIYAELRVQVRADEIDRQRKDRVGDDGRLGRPALSDAFRLDENRLLTIDSGFGAFCGV